jgi:hypothetical protein
VADRRELFARICFNAAVSNIDDHPRNHALLARSRSWQLSPAYDLTPAPVQAETRRDLAMACGLVERSPSRWANRRAILAAAGRFLLQPAEAEAILTRIFSTVASSWEASLREAAVSPGNCQRLSCAFLYPGLELVRRGRGLSARPPRHHRLCKVQRRLSSCCIPPSTGPFLLKRNAVGRREARGARISFSGGKTLAVAFFF